MIPKSWAEVWANHNYTTGVHVRNIVREALHDAVKEIEMGEVTPEVCAALRKVVDRVNAAVAEATGMRE